MPKLAAADRVVINLRQVAAVRMQIRLKFRSLTTGALGSLGVLIGDDNPLALLLNSLRARRTLRVLQPPRTRTSAGDAKVLGDERVRSEWYVSSAGV